jgi:hypothetical protein
MTLDATTKEVNIRASLQKYFIDNLENIEGENIIVGTDIESIRNLTKCIRLNFMERTTGNKILYRLQLIIISRQDDEGYTLDSLEETIDKYLYDTDGKYVAIPFYDISNLPNLNEIGKIHLRPQGTSATFLLDDRTKARVINITAHISAKTFIN